MAEITFLGTANALPNKDHDASHLLADAGDRLILVDCAGNPVIRLDKAGVDPLALTDVILTHFHPDHVSGLPLLLLDLMLLGRKDPLNIYGLHEVIDRVTKLMDLFEWQTWEDSFPVIFHRLPTSEWTILIDTDTIKVWSSLMCHAIPSIGLRMAFPGGTVCYSSDTAPCDALVRLAEGADILIHEATGEGHGHTSPEQAGEIAKAVGPDKLFLIHYPTGVDLDAWVGRVKSTYNGKVTAAQDWMTISI